MFNSLRRLLATLCHLAVMPVIFFENQDQADALAYMAALADPPNGIYEVSGDEVRLPPGFNNIVGVYGGLDHTKQPRLLVEATNFKKDYGRDTIEVPYINSGMEPGSPPLFNDLRADPIKVRDNSALKVQTYGDPAAAADQCVILWVSDGRLAPVSPQGGQWVRVTTDASAMDANKLNSRNLPSANWDIELDPGRYAVLGVRGYSTSAIFLTLEDGHHVHHTPVLAADAKADLVHPSFAKPGDWGVLTEFHTSKRPTSRWFVNAADNEAQVLDMFVKRTGA